MIYLISENIYSENLASLQCKIRHSALYIYLRGIPLQSYPERINCKQILMTSETEIETVYWIKELILHIV